MLSCNPDLQDHSESGQDKFSSSSWVHVLSRYFPLIQLFESKLLRASEVAVKTMWPNLYTINAIVDI